MINPVEIRSGTKSSQWPIIRLPAGGRKQVVLRLVDDKGKPVTLEEEPKNEGVDAPQFDYQRKIGRGNIKIVLRARHSVSDSTNVLDVEGRLKDGGCPNEVVFEIAEADVAPGIYVAEVGRFVLPDFLVDTWPCYLAFEPTVFQTGSHVGGPLTISEVRLAADDLDAGEVNLLDGPEFSDRAILDAIASVVDLWNETPPILRMATYTTSDFPYRYYWSVGVLAQLYFTKALSYARNQLNYSAGGLTIDDQNKSAEYQAIANQLNELFRSWMMTEKIRLNARAGWRSGI